MADSFQNEVPKARINLKLDLHTGGASKKTELPCNGPDIHSPLVQDFNFHTNLKKGS